MLINNRCGVYGVRPLLCQGHASFSRSSCEQAFQRDNQEMPAQVDGLSVAVCLHTFMGLMAGLTGRGYEPGPFDLPAALSVMLVDGAENPLPWQPGEGLVPQAGIPHWQDFLARRGGAEADGLIG